MNSAAKLFSEYLEQRNVKYFVADTDVIRVSFTGKNCPSIRISFIFGDDGRDVAIRSYSLAKVDENDHAKHAIACYACSLLNSQYRWIKFYLDEDNEITAADDAVIDPYTTGEECYELLMRTVDIIDKAYPIIMKTVWGLT